jgi:hypothetical protein
MVTVVGMPGNLNAVLTCAVVLTVTNKTMRDGLGQEVKVVTVQPTS